MLKYLALLTALLAFTPTAQAAGCAGALDRADEIALWRDRDPEVGVEKGLAELHGLELSRSECPVAQAMVHRAVAVNLHILGRIPEALEHIRSAEELLRADRSGPLDAIARVYLTAGVLYWDTEAHDEAIVYYLKALEASRSAGDLVGVGRAAGNIGNLYSTLGDYDRALDYHRQALSAFEEAGGMTGVAGSLVNLAALSGRLAKRAATSDEPDRAQAAYGNMLEYALGALDRFQTLENPRGIAYASANVAEALEGTGRAEAALEYHQRALAIQQELGDQSGQVQTLIAMARSRLALGDHDQAAALLDQAEQARAPEKLGVAIEIRALQVAVAEARQDYLTALEHQKEVSRLRLEISSNQMASRVEEMRLTMESEQREQEIELLRAQAQVADLTLKRQQALLISAVLIGLLLLGMLAMLYFRYRLRVRTSRQLDIASRTDPLTGLSNRRDMMERLAEARSEARRSGTKHGLLLADIDDFKHVNDDYGHSVGDEVLVSIARLMASSIKGRDVVCRWGGEEFLVLLPNTDLAGASAVAENLRRAISNQPIETSSRSFAISISLGVAVLDGATPVDEAVGCADRAMYRAKQAGKNRFETSAD
ncbi:MAG: tetratricopeptide repeat-containing diguanylate cyclase [Wenzhouxiangella sp.]|jgi:diguanylate cyclase (GGDEF)-like protein|nr:tetratricopeptide repeat-containing diguanylate cyclase [Wenzhouxiangella sp.]